MAAEIIPPRAWAHDFIRDPYSLKLTFFSPAHQTPLSPSHGRRDCFAGQGYATYKGIYIAFPRESISCKVERSDPVWNLAKWWPWRISALKRYTAVRVYTVIVDCLLSTLLHQCNWLVPFPYSVLCSLKHASNIYPTRHGSRSLFTVSLLCYPDGPKIQSYFQSHTWAD